MWFHNPYYLTVILELSLLVLIYPLFFYVYMSMFLACLVMFFHYLILCFYGSSLLCLIGTIRPFGLSFHIFMLLCAFNYFWVFIHLSYLVIPFLFIYFNFQIILFCLESCLVLFISFFPSWTYKNHKTIYTTWISKLHRIKAFECLMFTFLGSYLLLDHW